MQRPWFRSHRISLKSSRGQEACQSITPLHPYGSGLLEALSVRAAGGSLSLPSRSSRGAATRRVGPRRSDGSSTCSLSSIDEASILSRAVLSIAEPRRQVVRSAGSADRQQQWDRSAEHYCARLQEWRPVCGARELQRVCTSPADVVPESWPAPAFAKTSTSRGHTVRRDQAAS